MEMGPLISVKPRLVKYWNIIIWPDEMVVLYRKLSFYPGDSIIRDQALSPNLGLVTFPTFEKGYLVIPKRVTKNCQDIDFTFDFYMSSVFQVVLCLQRLLCDAESFFGRRCLLVLFHHPAMKTRAALCVVTLPQSKDSNGTWCIWGCILSYLSISYREQVMFHCHTFKHLLRMYLDPPNIPKTSSKIF